jgi:hypothetical protein
MFHHSIAAVRLYHLPIWIINMLIDGVRFEPIYQPFILNRMWSHVNGHSMRHITDTITICGNTASSCNHVGVQY